MPSSEAGVVLTVSNCVIRLAGFQSEQGVHSSLDEGDNDSEEIGNDVPDPVEIDGSWIVSDLSYSLEEEDCDSK